MTRVPALDALLRVREATRSDAAVLPPAAVHTIRRFADVPVLKRLLCVVRTSAGIVALEQIVAEHETDMRIDAGVDSVRLDDNNGSNGRINSPNAADTATKAQRVAQYAAQVGSLRVVAWMLSTFPRLERQSILTLAVMLGHAAIAEHVYRQVGHWDWIVSDNLVYFAALYGRLAVLQWLRREQQCARSWRTDLVLRNAAIGGHLSVLQYVSAELPHEWSPDVLRFAASNHHQHIMQWIYDARLDADVSGAMAVVAQNRRLDALAWLHDAYPVHAIALSVLEAMAASGAHHEALQWLKTHYPARYSSRSISLRATMLGRLRRLAGLSTPNAPDEV